jgi:endonuclease/exonuclease/phosphatase (EEP) superfamily protein YafD
MLVLNKILNMSTRSTAETSRKVIYLILCAIAVVVALASLLSIFTNTDNRYLKMLDFPRLQFFIVSVVSLVLFIILTKRWRWYDYALILALVGGMIVQGSYIVFYTPLVDTTVPSAATVEADQDQISLLIANIKMSNRNAQPFLKLAKEKDPDLILVMETDAWWDEQLTPLEEAYPYSREAINDVAYGMILYSKFSLTDMQTNYFQHDDVPSFDGVISLRSGRQVNLHTVHPVPPTRFKELPDNEGKEEVALLKVGERVANQSLPAIVAGDMNDLVWSYTDRLTGTKNLLHDVRVGRGFYNSYDVGNVLLRWPLDHVFVTKEFRLKTLERSRDIASDHFPIYVELVL